MVPARARPPIRAQTGGTKCNCLFQARNPSLNDLMIDYTAGINIGQSFQRHAATLLLLQDTSPGKRSFEAQYRQDNLHRQSPSSAASTSRAA